MSGMGPVGIVGAGNVGGALGERFAEVGIEVRFGVREPGSIAELVARCGGRAEAVSVGEAAQCEVVFVAVPSRALDDVVRDMGDLSGRVIVDCTNPVGPNITLAAPKEGSNAARIAALAPGARVVKGFNTFGAEFHRDPTIAGTRADVPLASDDAEAKAIVRAIAERAGFAVLDAGPLANAALVEAMALLWIHLAMRGGHGRQVAWKLLSRTEAR